MREFFCPRLTTLCDVRSAILRLHRPSARTGRRHHRHSSSRQHHLRGDRHKRCVAHPRVWTRHRCDSHRCQRHRRQGLGRCRKARAPHIFLEPLFPHDRRGRQRPTSNGGRNQNSRPRKKWKPLLRWNHVRNGHWVDRMERPRRFRINRFRNSWPADRHF